MKENHKVRGTLKEVHKTPNDHFMVILENVDTTDELSENIRVIHHFPIQNNSGYLLPKNEYAAITALNKIKIGEKIECNLAYNPRSKKTLITKIQRTL